jgi:hypothetical protein
LRDFLRRFYFFSEITPCFTSAQRSLLAPTYATYFLLSHTLKKVQEEEDSLERHREEKSSKSSLLSGKLAEFIVEELQQNREEL